MILAQVGSPALPWQFGPVECGIAFMIHARLHRRD